MTHTLEHVERCARRTGLAATGGALVLVFWGLWRGAQRPVGHKTGHEPRLMRTPGFYLLASVGYFGLCYRLWRPLPFALSLPARAIALSLGALLHFAGLALTLWGRLALGDMYDVSSGFGARLYAGHRLVSHGPYALVRHPMYLGILFVGAGGFLLYRTWTFLFVLGHFPALLIRARREEEVLAAEFGEQWQDYCRRVPGWRLRVFREP